jgi:hypothetical protein
MNSVLRSTGGVGYEAAELARIADYYAAHSLETLPPLPPDPERETLGFFPEALTQTPELSVTNVNAVDLTGRRTTRSVGV